MTSPPLATRRPPLVPGLLILLGLVPAAAGAARLFTLAAGTASPENARFFDAPVPVVLHVLAVVPYSLLGALQFAPARRGRWHRTAGMALAPLGLVAALTGLWMTQRYPWPAGDGEAVYVMRLLVGTAMTLALVRALAALPARDYAAHGAWMIRAYALGMGAGTQVLTHLPWFVLAGTPSETPRAVLMAAGWLINIAVAEWVIARLRRRRVIVSRALPAAAR